MRAPGSPRRSRRDLRGRQYVLAEAYPDDNFIADRAADRSGLELDELLREFGAFTGEVTFPRLYLDYFTVAGNPRSFLLTVETRIHELVRATIPNAKLPALTVCAAGESALEIDYSSPRRLCRLLEGLVIGTGRHYSEEVEVVEAPRMREVAAACRFHVRVRPARP
jgi:hypothetical protein